MNNKFDIYSSKVKRVNIPIPEFKFFHKASSEEQVDPKFIGREEISDKLYSWLKDDPSGGSYLVTGFRGMGKSSFVGRVLNELAQRTKGRYYFVGLLSFLFLLFPIFYFFYLYGDSVDFDFTFLKKLPLVIEQKWFGYYLLLLGVLLFRLLYILRKNWLQNLYRWFIFFLRIGWQYLFIPIYHRKSRLSTDDHLRVNPLFFVIIRNDGCFSS